MKKAKFILVSVLQTSDGHSAALSYIIKVEDVSILDKPLTLIKYIYDEFFLDPDSTEPYKIESNPDGYLIVDEWGVYTYIDCIDVEFDNKFKRNKELGKFSWLYLSDDQ